MTFHDHFTVMFSRSKFHRKCGGFLLKNGDLSEHEILRMQDAGDPEIGPFAQSNPIGRDASTSSTPQTPLVESVESEDTHPVEGRNPAFPADTISNPAAQDPVFGQTAPIVGQTIPNPAGTSTLSPPSPPGGPAAPDETNPAGNLCLPASAGFSGFTEETALLHTEVAVTNSNYVTSSKQIRSVSKCAICLEVDIDETCAIDWCSENSENSENSDGRSLEMVLKELESTIKRGLLLKKVAAGRKEIADGDGDGDGSGDGRDGDGRDGDGSGETEKNSSGENKKNENSDSISKINSDLNPPIRLNCPSIAIAKGHCTGHYFHTKCILRSILSAPACPVCRSPIPGDVSKIRSWLSNLQEQNEMLNVTDLTPQQLRNLRRRKSASLVCFLFSCLLCLMGASMVIWYSAGNGWRRVVHPEKHHLRHLFEKIDFETGPNFIQMYCSICALVFSLFLFTILIFNWQFGVPNLKYIPSYGNSFFESLAG